MSRSLGINVTKECLTLDTALMTGTQGALSSEFRDSPLVPVNALVLLLLKDLLYEPTLVGRTFVENGAGWFGNESRCAGFSMTNLLHPSA